MSKLVYGTCVECGRERVPGQRVVVDGEEKYRSNWHRRRKGSRALNPWGHYDSWCGSGKELTSIELRGTVAKPLPASEFDLKKLDDDQLQVLLERVESEMVRRAE